MGTHYSYRSGQILNPQDPSIPCGLAVKNFPRDQFTLFDKDRVEKKIVIKDLAFPGLKATNFKEVMGDKSWVSVENDQLINWVRPSTVPMFYKFWGRLQAEIKAGDYLLKIYNDLDTDLFGGEKFFVVGKPGHLGGKNYYISVGFGVGLLTSLF